jgi:glutamate mutase epsilon subunit
MDVMDNLTEALKQTNLNGKVLTRSNSTGKKADPHLSDDSTLEDKGANDIGDKTVYSESDDAENSSAEVLNKFKK